MISSRNKLLRNFTKEKDPVLRKVKYNQYKNLRNDVVIQIRNRKRNYYRSYFVKNLNNSKNTWKGIKELISLRKEENKNIIELNTDSKKVQDPTLIAEEFNNFFSEITKKIRSKIPLTNKPYTSYLKNPEQNSLFFEAISCHEIEKTINELDTNKSTRPFSVPNKIYLK